MAPFAQLATGRRTSRCWSSSLPRIALTQALVDGLPPEPGRVVEYRDAERRGLMLRIYPSGERSWFMWYQSTRRGERVHLGHVGHYSLKQARKIVEERLAALRLPTGGFSPPAGKEVVLVTGSGPRNVTVNVLVAAYLSEVPLAKATVTLYSHCLKSKITPHIGGRIAEEVTRFEWVSWGRMIRDTHGGHISNRAHQLVRAAYRWGAACGLIPSCSAVWEGMPVPYLLERPRKFVMSPEQLRAAWVALEYFDAKRLWQADAARLIMLTWSRVQQVTGMMRAEVLDLEDPKLARIVVDPGRPGSKRRQRNTDPKPHVIPVTFRAGQILKRRLMLTDGAALFPGRDPDVAAHICGFTSNFSPLWTRATSCVLASGPPPPPDNARGRQKWWSSAEADRSWHTHDIRASALTYALEHLGADLGLAPLMLGHSFSRLLPAATRIYDRSQMLDQRRALLLRWEAWLTGSDSLVESRR